MGETRSRTTLDIRVNARQVNELERQLQRVFSPRALMDFDRSLRGLTRSIMDLNRTAASGQASDRRWKDMADDLRRAREEAAQLTKELRELQARQREMGGGGAGGAAAGAAGAAGGGRGGGGFAGPRDGAGIRAGGAQLPMPGIGAMATAMSALPWMGLLFAGSLMAAAGTYQSHLGYQQASMGAAPHLGRARAPFSFPGDVAAATADNESKARGEYGPLILEGQQELQLAKMGMYRPRKEKYGERELDRSMRVIEWISERTGIEAPEDARPITPQGRLDQANDRLDRLYSLQKGEIGKARSRAVRASMRNWFEPEDYTSVGARFGVKPQQALQEASQMSRAGVRPFSAQEYEFGLSARSLFGLDLGTTGSLMGQMEYAGTSSAQSGNRVAQMIGSAVARGLESSEIATYLQRTNQFLQQQVNQGRQVDMSNIVRMEERLTASGIAGWRSGGIAQQFAGAGADIGYQGPQSAIEYRLMESMGFTGQGGFEEYARFRLAMQDPGKVAGAMPSFVGHINKRTKGMGRSGRALILQQYFAKLRTTLGPKEAAALSQGMSAGGLDMSGMGMGDIIAPGQIAAQGLGSSLIAEAGLERERVGIGADIAPTMQNLAGTVNNLASSFTNIAGPVLGKFTEALETATQKIEDYSFEFEEGMSRP